MKDLVKITKEMDLIQLMDEGWEGFAPLPGPSIRSPGRLVFLVPAGMGDVPRSTGGTRARPKLVPLKLLRRLVRKGKVDEMEFDQELRWYWVG